MVSSKTHRAEVADAAGESGPAGEGVVEVDLGFEAFVPAWA